MYRCYVFVDGCYIACKRLSKQEIKAEEREHGKLVQIKRKFKKIKKKGLTNQSECVIIRVSRGRSASLL